MNVEDMNWKDVAVAPPESPLIDIQNGVSTAGQKPNDTNADPNRSLG
jgi:hypothetical protein